MKITRKGFTLVELLIVIAIVGALSAVAMYNMRGTIGRAKAATIRATFDMCRTAAVQYYTSHMSDENIDSDTDGVTAAEFLATSLAGWASNKLVKGGITYTAGDGKGVSNWTVVATFPTGTAGAAEATVIAEALKDLEDITVTGTTSAAFTLIPNP